MIKTETNDIKQDSPRAVTPNVLIVDNDPQLIRTVLDILARKGIRGTIANDKKAATDFLAKIDYDLVLTNIQISRKSDTPVIAQGGFELLREIKSNTPETPVIMTATTKKQSSHQHGVDLAVKSILSGCSDFLIKPVDPKKIENLFDTFLGNHTVSAAASADAHDNHERNLYLIVGKSPKLLQTINLAKRIAPTSAPVLISGESGTGKELVSRLIHYKSKRANAPYIKVNCAALSDSLLESELFGHEKGAFTGAHIQRKGRFEMAHGGTLLLDEITETPLKFQAKLLRVLEQQDFERVGGSENIKVNVRIISTTNKDLLQEVQMGRFRQDLYYRLCGVRLIVAPLREREDDLTDLVWHFVNIYSRETSRRITGIEPTMMKIFKNYSWPGNVRQLRNVVLTSLILGVGEILSLADVSWLFDELQPKPQEALDCNLNIEPQTPPPATDNDLGGVALVNVEKRAILDTLKQTAGNRAKAAKVLGISDRTLREKMKRYQQQDCMQTTA